MGLQRVGYDWATEQKQEKSRKTSKQQWHLSWMLKERSGLVAGGEGARATPSGENLRLCGWEHRYLLFISSMCNLSLFPTLYFAQEDGPSGARSLRLFRLRGSETWAHLFISWWVSSVIMACDEILPRPGLGKIFSVVKLVMLPSTILSGHQRLVCLSQPPAWKLVGNGKPSFWNKVPWACLF